MRALNFTVAPGWTEILRRTGAAIYAGSCFGWAASLAFYFFLALFPALLFVVSLAGMLPVQDLIDRIVTMLSRVAPGDVVAIARQQFMQIARQPHGGVLTFSLIAAIWSTSSGMTAIVDTLNQAYRITESRPWWRVRVTAIALTLALTSLKFVAFALVVTALGCIYFAPDTRREWVWITPGSVTAAAIWLLVSLAFKWYVGQFADYQKTYGAIGGVMIALLWFYFSSLAILLGAQLDAAIEQASPEGQLGV